MPQGKTPERLDAPVSRGGPSASTPVRSSSNEKSANFENIKLRPMTLVSAGTLIALLFFAREVFIPISLAVLFSFLLAIPCSFLERHHFKRTPAVVVVVTLACSLVVGACWLLSSQFVDLAKKMPQYQEVIDKKLNSLKASPSGTIGQFSQMLRRTAEEFQAPDTNEVAGVKIPQTRNALGTNSVPQAIPVEVQQPRISGWGILGQTAGPILKPISTALVVLVLLIFMLREREDLRNRLIRLAGTDRIDLTTDALDEAANRVSRYISMQLFVNCCCGILIGIGLSIIGVPNPALWGVLAMILRFVPYVGIWISAVAPLAVSFAMNPGWANMAWTVGLYGAVELVTSNFIEPLLYGSSTGVTPLALLLAAIFWTWLWGPIGLLLSTPLTVCLAVVGLHMPQFRFLHILLGDEPVLTPDTRFYQRMLAMDREEADEIAENLLKEKPLGAVYEELIVPALAYAKEDLSRGRFTKEKENFVLDNISGLVEELAEESNTDSKSEDPPPEIVLGEPLVAMLPARDKADEIAGIMLARLLARRTVNAVTLPAEALTSDRLDKLEGGAIRVVCVSVVPPTNLRRARYLCKKLHVRFPDMKLVIGYWGNEDQLASARERLSGCDPDSIVSTFDEAITALTTLSTITGEVKIPDKPQTISPRLPAIHAKVTN
ncbi:MAG TPA: AI-2E family transporter [Verrucomicrobiae bacterium]|jgi:predicted PurR-regulated permease PerM